MALVTRCPECATLFKVVPDQLRISEGWVRCGHCNEVFDASVDLHQQPNEALLPAAATPLPVANADAGQPEPQPWRDAEEPEPVLHLEFPDSAQHSSMVTESAHVLPEYDEGPGDDRDRYGDMSDSANTLAVQPSLSNTQAALEAEFDRELQALEEESAVDELNAEHSGPLGAVDGDVLTGDSTSEDAAAELAARSGSLDPVVGESWPKAPESAIDEMGDAAADAVEPSVPDMPSMGEDAVFVAPLVSTAVDDQAEPLVPAKPSAASVSSASAPSAGDYAFLRGADVRSSIWRKPAMRYGLMGLASVLLLVLGLQWLVFQREVVAAHWPQSRALLVSVCESLGCSVSALRRIDAIAIDSSAFTSLRRGAYRLNVVLKNRSPYPLAVPSIELALTDSQEQAVIRRVIPPHELGVRAEAIAANGELVAAVELAVPDGEAATRIVGYRLLAFYP
ncbi:zinc-ribbon and DUF3426 domain-containing protein [Variovorax sp. HJSM1_2]|uniref:zinc-ribbon and DUF3426 domain-containing protein n=1 Tax=Variovorax sp. HJSM1_2 TaxID=3366263 RepID=UPI003BBF1F92